MCSIVQIRSNYGPNEQTYICSIKDKSYFLIFSNQCKIGKYKYTNTFPSELKKNCMCVDISTCCKNFLLKRYCKHNINFIVVSHEKTRTNREKGSKKYTSYFITDRGRESKKHTQKPMTYKDTDIDCIADR